MSAVVLCAALGCAPASEAPASVQPATPPAAPSPMRALGPCFSTSSTPTRSTVEWFDYDATGRRVGARQYGVDEDPTTAHPRRQVFIEYDERGRRSKEVVVDETGIRIEYLEYDERGILIASQEDHTGDGTFVLRHERVYDADDRLVERRTLDLRTHPPTPVMERRLRYDAAGRLAGEEISRGGSIETVHVVLDDAGRVTVRVRDTESDGTTDEVQTFVYDGSGRLWRTVLERGSVRETAEQRYDANGRLLATVRTAADGTVLSQIEHDYSCRATPA